MKARKALSLLLALMMCMGMTVPMAKADGDEDYGFYAMNLTNAGATSMNNSGIGGDYYCMYEGDTHLDSTESLKQSLMSYAATMDDLEYYLLASDTPTVHLLTIYGTKPVDADKLDVSGSAELASEGFTRGTFGSDERIIYYYYANISVSANGGKMNLLVDNKTVYSTDLNRLANSSSPARLLCTLEIKDYTEDPETKCVTSFVLRMSGFGIYSSKTSFYRVYDERNPIVDENGNKTGYRYYPCTGVSKQDEAGWFDVTFSVGEYKDFTSLSWMVMRFFDNTNVDERYEGPFDKGVEDVFFFDLRNIKHEYVDGEYVPAKDENGRSYFDLSYVRHTKNEIDYKDDPDRTSFEYESDFRHFFGRVYSYFYNGGNNADIACVYYCIYKEASGFGLMMDTECSPQTDSVSGHIHTINTNRTTSAVLVGAWYDENGALLACNTQAYELTDGRLEFELDRPDGAENAYTCQVFLLDGETFAPLRAARYWIAEETEWEHAHWYQHQTMVWE
ncbi:MAG: hypothetical protein J5449_00150 [Oscillospiraceae bacterium]|nr:hypothetical protein [Oscillospiraceae bacterium]